MTSFRKNPVREAIRRCCRAVDLLFSHRGKNPPSGVRRAMITQVLHCPYCHSTDIVKHGLSPEGKQRYRCRACLEGRGRTFLLEYTYAGQAPEVKQQIVDMAMNASGIRDTARVLHVSPTTVIKELKKKEPELDQVNQAVLKHLPPEHVEVEIWRADALEVRRGLSSELDEMWSYVRSKANPRWLWHAIDHHTGKVLAYVFGQRKDSVFLQLQELLEPFGITKFQIPSDLVVKSQVTDIIDLLLQLVRHPNGVHRSCHHRKSRGAVLSTSAVQRATTKFDGV